MRSTSILLISEVCSLSVCSQYYGSRCICLWLDSNSYFIIHVFGNMLTFVVFDFSVKLLF